MSSRSSARSSQKAKPPARPQTPQANDRRQNGSVNGKQAAARAPQPGTQVANGRAAGPALPRQQAPGNASVDAKREARFQRQAAERAAAARRQRAKSLRVFGIAAAAVFVVLAVIVGLYIREANKPGQSVDVMANRTHLTDGQVSPVSYSTDPPTSGPHVSTLPDFKVYSEPITKELQVHGLEDGAVVINYKPDLDKGTVDKLAAVAQSYYEQGGYKNLVILSPYPGLSNAIVLTAWGRIDRLDAYDEARIRRFVDEYVGWDHHEGKEGQRVR